MSTEKIYCVYCHTCPNGLKYYGATKNVKERWKPSHYKNGTLFKDAIIEFGWESIKHEVITSGLTRDEALKLEDQLIVKARENGTCINMVRSGHYTQTDEYREEHNARSMDWQKANPEKVKVIQKKHYEKNKEKINAYSRAYQKAHPERRRKTIKTKPIKTKPTNKQDKKAQNKAYYEKNKEKIKTRARERYNRKKGGGDKPEPLF